MAEAVPAANALRMKAKLSMSWTSAMRFQPGPGVKPGTWVASVVIMPCWS